MEPSRTAPLKGLLERILAMLAGDEPARAVLLVGGIGSGKTSTGLRLLSLLRQSGVRVGGFLAPRILRENETTGYSLIELATNATHPFADTEPGEVAIGRFYVSENGLAVADRAVSNAIEEAQVAFIDEIGRLELGEGGHASAVRRLLASECLPILLVRDEFVERVETTFDIEEPIHFAAQEAFNGTVAGPAGVKTFWEIVDSIPHPLLVTLGERGFPESRPMYLVERQGRTLWFPTSRASRKVAQIAAHQQVTILFVDSARFNYASICGRAEVVADPGRRRVLWRDEWRDDWPTGPADPDYVLLRIEGVCGRYLRGTTGESGTLDLA